MLTKPSRRNHRRVTGKKRTSRQLRGVERLEDRRLLAGELMNFLINPRTASDEPFSETAFNRSTRELNVEVGEVFHLEILYTDNRPQSDRLGAFAVFTDILFDNQGIAGIIEPALTETQVVTFGTNLANADSGPISISLESDPSNVAVVDFRDYRTNAAAAIAEALQSLGVDGIEVLVPNPSGLALSFTVRYTDAKWVDRDVPNFLVNPNLSTSGEDDLDIDVMVDAIPPRRPDGTINNAAIQYNLDLDSRTIAEPRSQRSGETFYSSSISGTSSYDAAIGFTDVGVSGPLIVGYPALGRGPLPRPFDAFSIPVRITQPVERLKAYLDTTDRLATANLLYGTDFPVPTDLIRIDLENNPTIADDGTGLLFITAVEGEANITINAGDGVIETPAGEAVQINLLDLVVVDGTDESPTIVSLGPPSAGTVSFTSTPGVVSYQPPAGFVGSTSFTYTASVAGITATGTISVNVTAFGADAYEPNNSLQTAFNAGTLTYASTISGLTIHRPDDRDFFQFETVAQGGSDHFVEIQFDHSVGDVDMRLWRADGLLVAESSGVGNTERISFQDRLANSYILEVYGFAGATNEYTIQFSAPELTLPPDDFESNDTLETAFDLGRVTSPIREDSLTIHSSADRDFFRIETVATGRAEDFVQATFNHAVGDIDMRLYNEFGVVIAVSAGVTNTERISLQGLEPGVYFGEIFGYAGAINRYEITLSPPDDTLPEDRFESNNSVITATDFGQVSGTLRVDELTIHNSTDIDLFRFEISDTGGADHYAEIKFTHGSGDLDMRLLDSNGNAIAFSTGVSDSERISLLGLSAGTYFIEAYGFLEAKNRYDLMIVAPENALPEDRFESNDSLATATNLRVVNGLSVHNGLTIHDSEDRDFIRFEISDNGTDEHWVQADFSHSSGDIDMRLLDRDGKVIATSAGVTDREFISLQGLRAGIYIVEVYGFVGAVNRYDFAINGPSNMVAPDRFEQNNSRETATDLRQLSGVTTQDNLSIHSDSDRDFYRFEILATGGSDHYVQTAFNHSAGDIDMRLLDADGNEIASSLSVTDVERISLVGRSPGVYYLEVYGFNANINSYSLVISAPETTVPQDRFEFNDSFQTATDLRRLSGTNRFEDLSIHTAADRDFYRFEMLQTGNPLSRVELDFRHNRGNLNLNLYDSTNRLITQASSTSDDERVSLAGLPAGVYYVEVVGVSGAMNRYNMTVFTPVGSQGLPMDRFESNNERASATDLRELDQTVSYSDLTIHNAADRDFFRFTTLAAGTADSYAKIDFSHEAGDLAIRLLNASGNVVGSSQTTLNSELISLDGLPAGTYFVEVFGVDGAFNDYDLQIRPPSRAGFDIEVEFPPGHGFTAAQQEIIRRSAARWEEIIIGDIPPVQHSDGTIIDDVRIQFSARNDLPPNVLGRAFSPLVRPGSLMPYFGRTEYSSQYLASRTDEQFLQTVNHEIAHILGMFTPRILAPLGLVTNYRFEINNQGTVTAHDPNVRYVGRQAVEKFQEIFNTNLTYIPLEGRPLIGSYGSHWPVWFGPEVVMTFGGAPISEITVGVMADIGYRVDMSAADPFVAPPNTPPSGAAGEGEFGYDGALHHGSGGDHDEWEIVYVDEVIEPGEVLALLPFEMTVAPDDYESVNPVILQQSQRINGLSIHDPLLWDSAGDQVDLFQFTLDADGHSSQFLSVTAGRPNMDLAIRLFDSADVNRQSPLFDFAISQVNFSGLSAGTYIAEVVGGIGDYELELNLGRPITSDQLVGTFWGETLDISFLDEVISVAAPLANRPIEILSDPAAGTVTVMADGRLQFNATEGFVGETSFELRVFDEDGNPSDPATVTVRVVGSKLQNPLLRADVLRDTRVEPLDALVVLNRLSKAFREGLQGALMVDSINDEGPRVFYDVDGNGRVEPLDALLVLNQVAQDNRDRLSEGELVSEENHITLPIADSKATTVAVDQAIEQFDFTAWMYTQESDEDQDEMIADGTEVLNLF